MPATWYISPTGDDGTGDGSQGNPWQTISMANTSSAGGDTIRCLVGTYTTWSSESFNHALTIMSDNGDPTTTIFDGGAAALFWYNAADLTINGLGFQNAAGASLIPIFRVLEADGANAVLQNCIFNGLTADSNEGGIFGCYSVLTGTVVITCLIQGCLFNNCVSTIIGNATTGICGTTRDGIVINFYNNTVYSNSAGNITLHPFDLGSTTTLNLKNNIFYNANGSAKAWDASTGATTAGSNNDYLGYSGTPSLTGDISADPLFVDASGGNFALRPASPCIDAGVIV